MTGNKQFIHAARKNQDPIPDLKEKSIIQDLLRIHFKIPALINEYVYINKNTGKWQLEQPRGLTKEAILEQFYVHECDLMIKCFVDTIKIIEIDGPVHWQNSKAVKRTNARNEWFELAKIEFCWFTKDEVLSKKPNELVKRLVEFLRMDAL